MKNCTNFIRRHEICRVWDVFLSQYPSQRLRVFLPPYERLYSVYFAKRETTMSPQSPIELICGLTRRQESSGILQTLTLRKSPLQIPVFFTIDINAIYQNAPENIKEAHNSF